MKRIFDIGLFAVFFVPITIMIWLLSLLILFVDGFSPFHFQYRVGKNGKLFLCCKLQTMRPPKYDSLIGERERDFQRITKLGKVIRDHGWDELPQIFNVLSGEMSFIGPRPLLVKTLDRIKSKNPEMQDKIALWQILRENVKPGISGWHQIQEGASIIECDFAYFQKSSLHKKTKIVLRTLLIFLFGKSRKQAPI